MMDIAKMSVQELLELQVAEQEKIINALAVLQQSQQNIGIIKAEIEKRKEVK